MINIETCFTIFKISNKSSFFFSCSIENVPNPVAAVSVGLAVVTPVQIDPVATVKSGAGTLAALTPKELPSVAAAVPLWIISGE